jgi:hypothetical protein
MVALDKNQLMIKADILEPGYAKQMLLLLADEPGQELYGPFEARVYNVWTTKARYTEYFPFEMVEHLLGYNLTAHQVYELMRPEILDSVI